MLVVKYGIFKLRPRKESLRTRLDLLLKYPTCSHDLWVASSTFQGRLPLFSVFFTFIFPWLSSSMINFSQGVKEMQLFVKCLGLSVLKMWCVPETSMTLRRRVQERDRLVVSLKKRKSPSNANWVCPGLNSLWRLVFLLPFPGQFT